MLLLGYLGALLTGVSLGLIGGGGSILIVPVLVYLFHVTPTLATAYSLFIVGVTSLISAVKYARIGLLDYKTAVIFAAPSFLGVFVARRYLLPMLPEQILTLGEFVLTKDALIMLVFAVIMLAASYSMIRPAGSQQSEASEGTTKARATSGAAAYNYQLIALEGLGVGAITGFVGAGGGFLIIPALVLLAKLEMKLAVGTSLVIIAVKSLFGFLGDLGGGQPIEWAFLVGVAAVAVCGAFIGTYVSRFVPGKKLQPAFGWFVLAMGIFILSRQLI
jgi:uncharacterized membrane protein YfcA